MWSPSQVSSHSRSSSLDGNCSVYKNTAALFASLQHSQLHPTASDNNNQRQSILSAPKKNHDGLLHSGGYTTNVGLSASLYNSLNTLLSQAHSKQPPDGLPFSKYGSNHSCPRPLNDSSQPFSSTVTTQPQRNNSKMNCVHFRLVWFCAADILIMCCYSCRSCSLSDFSPPPDQRSLDPWGSEVTGYGHFEDDFSSSPSLTPLLPPQAYLSLEGQNGEDAGEENVVYL